MNTPVKLILGAVATGCIAIGVAAQTGTVLPPRANFGRGGAVSGQQQAAPATTPSPSADASPSSQPTPDTTTVAAPVSSDDEDGDGQGHGNGHGHKDECCRRRCTNSKPKRPFTQRCPLVTLLSSGDVTLTMALSWTCSSSMQPTPQ